MNENKLPKTYEVGIVNIPDHLEEGYDNLIFVLEWWEKSDLDLPESSKKTIHDLK
jgi:hypothetical protein